MQELISSDKKLVLKKHVNAIHCTNSLTITQRKISNAFLYNAYRNLMDCDFFEIRVKDLCSMIGYTSRNYKALVDALRGLTTTAIEWGVLTTTKNLKDISWGSCPILASVEIKKGTGVCTYEYSRKMKELLHNPDMFGLIDIKKQALFKSTYGLALYETCCRFKDIPNTKWISILELRKLMGVSEDKYPRYFDFKKRILNVAVKEVNENSGFNIELEERKNKRIVTHVRILISHPQEGVLIKKDEEDQNQNPAVINELVNTFGVNEKVAIKLFSDYGADYVSDKISIVKANISSNPSKKVANLAGLIVSAISNNYEKSKTSKEITDEARNKKLAQEAEQMRAQKEQEEINKKYQLYRSNLVSEYLVSVPDDELDELHAEFYDYCKKNNQILALKSLSKDNDLDKPMVKAAFNQFVISEKMQGRVMSREEFIRVG